VVGVQGVVVMLRRILGSGLLLALFVVFAPVSAFAQKKDAKPKEDTPTVDADKLTPGEFTGKLQTTPGSDGSFTLRTEYKHVVVDQKALDKALKQAGSTQGPLHNLAREQQHIAQLQMDLQRARNAQDLMHRQQQLLQAVAQFERTLAQAQAKANTLPNNTFKTVTDHKDIDFHAAAEVKVRILTLPESFDEKGNVKKFTKEELDELKGKDKNLPGYQSTVDKLQVGQTVKVTLAVNRPVKQPMDKKDDQQPEEKKEPAKPGEKPEAKPTEPRNVATVIVITEEAPPGAGGKNDPKKKK